jgi:hypothetical protein
VNLHGISPTPSDEEAAAILEAIEALWPKPQAATASVSLNTDWRFSGRWWNYSAVIRRTRPGF